MAVPYSTILNKVDRALVAYLETKSIGTANIYTGKRALDKEAPCVICHTESGTEEDQSGNWRTKTSIIVRTSASDGTDPLADSQSLVGKTFDAIMQGIAGEIGNDSALANLLSAQGVTDFTAFTVRRTGIEQGTSDDCWEDVLNLEVYCAPSTIT